MKKRIISFALCAVLCLGLSMQVFALSDSSYVNVIDTANNSYTAIVKEDGTLWAWGGGSEAARGEFGFNTVLNADLFTIEGGTWSRQGYINRPAQVTQVGSNVSAVSGGLVIKNDHSLWAFGSRHLEMLGKTASEILRDNTPIKLMDDVSYVSSQIGIYAIIKNDRSLWLWGRLGTERLIDPSKPAGSLIKIMDDVVSVATSQSTVYAVKSDGSLWVYGAVNVMGLHEFHGLPGTPTGKEFHSEPVKIMDGVASVATDTGQTIFVIKKDASLWGCGSNSDGNLGDGTKTYRSALVKIMDDVKMVDVSRWNSIALKTDGSVWAWGNNEYGQIGDGTTVERLNPIRVMDGVVAISSGGEFNAAIKTDGTLWMWGINGVGQLGDGTTTDRHSPVKIMDGVKLPTGSTSTPTRPTTPATSTTPTTDEIKVIVNGTTLAFDQPPIVVDGRTLVPLRAIFEALGATVEWDAPVQAVYAERNGTFVTMQIGHDILYKNSDEEIKLDVPPQIVNGRTLVPARAVAESFGADVKWDANTRTVTITEPASQQNPKSTEPAGGSFEATGSYGTAGGLYFLNFDSPRSLTADGVTKANMPGLAIHYGENWTAEQREVFHNPFFEPYIGERRVHVTGTLHYNPRADRIELEIITVELAE